MTTCRCGQPTQSDDCECARCEAFAREAHREEPAGPDADGTRPALQHLHPHVGVRPGMAGEVRGEGGAVLAHVTCVALDAGLALPFGNAFDAQRSGWLLTRTPQRGERALPEVLAMGRPMRHLHGDPETEWAWASFWAFAAWGHRLPTDRSQGLGLGERIVVWFPRHTWQDQLSGLSTALPCERCGWLRPDCHCRDGAEFEWLR